VTARPLTIALAAALALTLSLGGCATDPNRGYAFGETYDDSIRTIAVPIFDNSTQSRTLEVTLTNAIIKQIQTRTPWRIAESAGADTILRGSLDNVTLRSLSRIPGVGYVQEQAVTLTVSYQWRDNRTGDILSGRTRLGASATFIPSAGGNERIEHAQREAIEELAAEIVSQLRSSW
jgi:hypothetical protein